MKPQNKLGIILLSVLLCSSLNSSALNKLGFESSEHLSAGDDVKLYFSAQDKGTTGYELHLPNGLTISYGELVTLGDFYGIVGKPISDGTTETERQLRFIAAFNSFAENQNTIPETTQILDVVYQEQKAIEDGIQKGEKAEDVFARISNDDSRQWNCITGGGCGTNWWLQAGRYLQLGKEDFDHFGMNALLAYQAGHTVAVNEAIQAHQTHDLSKLEVAYAMNAFACHFLSDRFASGHIRTPRVELAADVTPSVLGSLLSAFMHNEENQYGFKVHNLRGDSWTVYGDKYYFDKINENNRSILHEAMQSSANQIFAAYQSGNVTSDDGVSQLIPKPDEMGRDSHQDIASLFYWDSDSQTLFRRVDTANVYDRHWTSHWWGWSTLALLAKNQNLPVEAQAELAVSHYGNKAFQEGLITDKNIINYLKKKNAKS